MHRTRCGRFGWTRTERFSAGTATCSGRSRDPIGASTLTIGHSTSASPDLSSWQWKDEDELEIGQRLGLYSSDNVVEIRAAGAAVIELIERCDAIFDEWRAWTAPSDWLVSPPKLRA
jgi:hypothetical protein